MIASPSSDAAPVVLKKPTGKEAVLPVAAIYGANASGKTNVLRALAWLSRAVETSQRIWHPEGGIPGEPFKLDNASAQNASRFVVDFAISSSRYQYGLALTTKQVEEEWLYAYPSGRKQEWFSRVPNKPIEFSSKLTGENRVIEALTRSNSLFLSAAAQNNHELLTPIYKWFSSSLGVATSDRSLLRRFTVGLCRRGEYRRSVAELLQSVDLGVSGLRITRRKQSPDRAKLLQELINSFQLNEEEADVLLGSSDGEIELLHQAGSKSVPFSADEESDGTSAYLAIIGPILNALAKGHLFCIDELDASLHPLLALEIIKYFSDPQINRNGAQLIFNTHDSNLLSSKWLRRDQIWFTEKDREGASHLYPLTDFKPRKGENLENGYLQGRYGAIPFINSASFLTAPESRHEAQ